VLKRVIKEYTDKFSRFSDSEFAIFDEEGRLIAGTKNYEKSEDDIKVELDSIYGKMYLYLKSSADVERESELLKFLYTELLGYEGYIESLVRELAHRQEELGIVYDMIAKASLVFDEKKIVDIVLDKINSLISPKACVIGIFEGGSLSQKYMIGEISQDLKSDAERLILKASETKNFVIYSKQQDSKLRGMLAVPMFSGDNLIGGIFVCSEGKSFETMEAKLLLTLGNYAGIILYRNKLIDEIKRTEILKREVEIARQIQESLLPKEIPKWVGLDIYAFIKPSSSVGGDYYDFLSNDGRYAFLIADVSGHGIGSALLLSSLRSVIRLTYEFAQDIPKLLSSINRIIYNDTSKIGMYSTVFIGEYRHEGVLVYSNAGHIPPILFRRNDRSIMELEVHGSPIGLFDNEIYEASEVRLFSGDVLIAFTDGVTEAKNEKNDFFGLERLKNIIIENCDKSAFEICTAIVDKVMEFKGAAEQRDDITLLVLKKI
jgi:sigma-B regulation protein RsbU (phosphoserine phosphatase)